MFDALRASFARKSVLKGIEKLRAATVRDIMTPSVISIRPEDTVIHAATKLIAEDISCLAVIKSEEMKGILSERDFLHEVPLNKKVFNMKVADIMTANVVTTEPDVLLTDAVAVMKKNNFRRLPVKAEELGLVTQTDFSELLAKVFSAFPISDALTLQSIMSKKVLTATTKETFSVARNKMKKLNVGSIIIEDKGVPQGIFTEYDIVMQFYDQEGQLRVKELDAYMRKYIRGAPKEMNIFEANALLLKKRMRRLPVVEEGKIIGIVTQTDIVRFVFTNLDKILDIAQKAESFGKAQKEYPGEFVGDHLKVY